MILEKFSIFNWKKNELVFVIGTVAGIMLISSWQLAIGGMKTRDAQRKADTALVARALGRYFSDYAHFPPEENGRIVSCGREGQEICEWGEGPMIDQDNVQYLPKIPRDPWAEKGWTYVYKTDDSGQNFTIYSGLEYRRDKQEKTGLTEKCSERVQCKWFVKN